MSARLEKILRMMCVRGSPQQTQIWEEVGQES